MPVKHAMISGTFIENFRYQHHVVPRDKLYMPREESFPIPLRYFDVTGSAHTTLDVLQESRIDDSRNIYGSRDLSDSWTGFTQFTSLKEMPPDGYRWSGARLTKRQATSRPDQLRSEKYVKQLEMTEKQQVENQCSRMPESVEVSCFIALERRGVQRDHPKNCTGKIRTSRSTWYAL